MDFVYAEASGFECKDSNFEWIFQFIEIECEDVKKGATLPLWCDVIGVFSQSDKQMEIQELSSLLCCRFGDFFSFDEQYENVVSEGADLSSSVFLILLI